MEAAAARPLVAVQDGLDLLEVHNTTGGTDDLLAKYTYGSSTPHKPDTVTDASGQVTKLTIKEFGDVKGGDFKRID